MAWFGCDLLWVQSVLQFLAELFVCFGCRYRRLDVTNCVFVSNLARTRNGGAISIQVRIAH